MAWLSAICAGVNMANTQNQKCYCAMSLGQFRDLTPHPQMLERVAMKTTDHP